MHTSDADLVAAALADADAFGAIIIRYQRPLISFIFARGSLSRADAEDIVQQVFIKAYEHLNDFDQAMKLSTWLFAIARNEGGERLAQEAGAPHRARARY